MFKMRFRRPHDLQPVLDYFQMLQAYVRGGYLEVLPAAHEAYVTIAALHVLAGTEDSVMAQYQQELEQGGVRMSSATGGRLLDIWNSIRKVVLYIRLYSIWLNTAEQAYKQYQQEADNASRIVATSETKKQAYQNKNRTCQLIKAADDRYFCLHVVGYQYPHNLIYTVVCRRVRCWWWPWHYTYRFNVIDYIR